MLNNESDSATLRIQVIRPLETSEKLHDVIIAARRCSRESWSEGRLQYMEKPKFSILNISFDLNEKVLTVDVSGY